MGSLLRATDGDPSALSPHVRDQLAAGSDLLATWWPSVAALVLAVALVVWAVRSRRRRARAWPGVIGAVLVVAAGVALGVNTWSGYVPSLASATRLVSARAVAATETTGALTPVSIPMPDAVKMPESTTWIYTPPGYDAAAATRYPVIMMIHGTPGRSADWTMGGDIGHTMDVLIANGLIQPMIVVMPEVNGFGLDQRDTECLNSTRGGPQVETYLASVVLPWVDAHYATAATWQSRAIGGLSSGAFCAMDQGLRHPELYGAIASIEGYDNPGDGGRAMLATDAEYAAHSPGAYIATMTFEHRVPVFVGTAGKGDATDRLLNQKMAAALEARGQDVEYRNVANGYHTWITARELLPYALIFASDHLNVGTGIGPGSI
jgi:enterochelin esterase-like enzyme